MEVVDQADAHLMASELTPWDSSKLKQLRADELHSSIYAVSHGVVQHTYHYNEGHLAELTIRRTLGLERAGSKLDLMWLRGFDSCSNVIYIGVDAEYVYERTGMLSSAAVVQHANQTTVPVFDVLVAVVFELEPILGIQAEALMSEVEVLRALPEGPLTDYLALDHKRRTKAVFFASRAALDSMEANARDHCTDYWQRQDQFAAFIRRPIGLGLYLSKRLWEPEEYQAIQIGDLLALQGLRTSPDNYRLRGYLRLINQDVTGYKYEVQFNMNENEVDIEFTGESVNDPQQQAIHLDVPPHEQIELDVVAGRTTIPLGELCAVQKGTLIELGRSNLPTVMLCVNGEAVLEGELVHFKDQIMVQVTKRLV